MVSYVEGEIFEEAKVTNITDFGAFVEIEPFKTGLIHYSQIVPKTGYGEISSVLSIGQKVRCAISEIKPDGKIGLTMKMKSRESRRQRISEVKDNIANMSEEDTSLRSIWMVLTSIQHYMLKYLQMPVPIKAGSSRLSQNGTKLIAQIDSQIHFETFKSEVRRKFGTDVIRHKLLPDVWCFETDVELCWDMQEFVDSCVNMYVSVNPKPTIEIQIKDADGQSREIIKTRLQNYYSQLGVFELSENLMVVTIPYTRRDMEDMKEELSYALKGIKEGVQDSMGQGGEKKFAPAKFEYEIDYPKIGCDRFLLTLNNEALLDKEGLRFSGLYGQSFIVKNGEQEYKLGRLCGVDYPNVTFNVSSNDFNIIKSLVDEDGIDVVVPDTDDITGEIEKVNRLRDSFERITEHPERLVNPQLASYLFDTSKAKELEAEVIEKRVKKIRQFQLNESLNESQIYAIAKAVEAEDLAVIQGPPGTGKSTAIAELIWQLALDNPKSRTLLTSEANLAVDNALDRLKFSCHNIIKPIRLAAGDRFSTEGFAYSQVEMKKWAGIELSFIDKEDNDLAKDTDEYKSFDPQELVLVRWMKNIYRRSEHRLQREDLKRIWYGFLTNLPSSWREDVYNEYVSHCNVIGATCSSISETNYSASEEEGTHKDSRFIKRFRAIFAGDGKGGMWNYVPLRFNTVIQDEASKATPAELSLPLIYGKKAVVIGDHRQLPPNLDKEDILFKLHVQRLKCAREEHDQIRKLEAYVEKNFDILEKSHFERMFKQINSSLRGTFDTQYRMHRDINNVIEQFYIEDGGLKCGVADETREHGIDIPDFISPDNHVIWINTSSPEVRDGTSRANRGEVDAIEWALMRLSRSKSFRRYQESLPTAEDREIGLITFYGSQLKRLRKVVQRSAREGLNIKLSSVDRFQGMERNIIIVSMVRSNSIAQTWEQKPDHISFPDLGYPRQGEYGFAKSPNRLNVALSRAKRLLIIVGNSAHFNNYTNSRGQAIYKNVFDEVKGNPNGRIIEWNDVNPNKGYMEEIVRVPMPKQRSVNLNTRDINAETDKNLRTEETWLTRDRKPIDNPHFAVLELSTKAVKLLIGIDEEKIRTSEEFDFNNFIREASKPEVGKGLDSQNVMNMDYFRGRVLPVIMGMKRKMSFEDVDVVYTVATAAYRTARNRDEIIECIRKEAGINVCILSKKEESIATMYAYGITSKYKLDIIKSRHSVMIDQGGGSTEVSVFNQGELEGSYSINLGTTALRNMLTKDVPQTTPIREAFRNSDLMLRERIATFTKNMGTIMQSEEDTFCVSVGTAITRATGKHGNAKQHDSVLDYEQLSEKVRDLTETLSGKFKTVGDLVRWEEEGGDDTIDGMITMRVGLPMYLLLMEKFNIRKIHICGTGLWYGIYLRHLYNAVD